MRRKMHLSTAVELSNGEQQSGAAAAAAAAAAVSTQGSPTEFTDGRSWRRELRRKMSRPQNRSDASEWIPFVACFEPSLSNKADGFVSTCCKA